MDRQITWDYCDEGYFLLLCVLQSDSESSDWGKVHQDDQEFGEDHEETEDDIGVCFDLHSDKGGDSEAF